MPQEAPMRMVTYVAVDIYAIVKKARDLLSATTESVQFQGYLADLHEKMEIEHEHRIATRTSAEST